MMMSRKVLIGIVIGIGIISCSGVSSEELASLAAKGYYEHLIHGEYVFSYALAGDFFSSFSLDGK